MRLQTKELRFKSNRLTKATLHLAYRFSMATTLLLASIAAQAAHAEVAKTYEDSCAACHDSGALNAPKKGDKAHWNKLRQQKSMAQLVSSVKEGMTQMPAGGLCSDCSDEDYRQLIEYMSK